MTSTQINFSPSMIPTMTTRYPGRSLPKQQMTLLSPSTSMQRNDHHDLYSDGFNNIMGGVEIESNKTYRRYLLLYQEVRAHWARAVAEFQYFKIFAVHIHEQMIALRICIKRGIQMRRTSEEQHEFQRQSLKKCKELEEKYQPSSLNYPWRREEIIQLNLELKSRLPVPKMIEEMAKEFEEIRMNLSQKVEEAETQIKELKEQSAKLREQRQAIQQDLKLMQQTRSCKQEIKCLSTIKSQ